MPVTGAKKTSAYSAITNKLYLNCLVDPAVQPDDMPDPQRAQVFKCHLGRAHKDL
jgi:hypothetical protein